MKYISLFAGIGGMDLGFDRQGFQCVAQVEIDEYCRKVLHKHWPEVPKYGDITTVRGCDLPECNVLAGGFPCQDISQDGKGAGIDGARSGLWRDFSRLASEIRPDYVVVENVAALLNRGMSRVLGDLSEIGYDAEWRTLRGWDFGLAHKRERVFIIAYPNEKRLQGRHKQTSNESWAFGAPRRRIKALSETAFWRDLPEPVVHGGNNGVPDRVGRSQGVGNSIPPVYAEYIAQCIKRHSNTP